MSWACIIKKLEVLEQISGHKVQLKSKSHKEKNVREHNISAPTTNFTWLLKQHVVPKSSVPPTQHILQKSGANSAWTQCDSVLYKIIPGFITDVLYHGRSNHLIFPSQSPVNSIQVVLLVSVIMHL